MKADYPAPRPHLPSRRRLIRAGRAVCAHCIRRVVLKAMVRGYVPAMVQAVMLLVTTFVDSDIG